MSSAPAAVMPAGFPAMSIAQAHQLLISTPGSPFEIEEREIRGVKIKTWKNAPPTLKDVSELNRPLGPRTYIVLDNERVTFDAHRAAVGHLAKRLVEDGVVAVRTQPVVHLDEIVVRDLLFSNQRTGLVWILHHDRIPLHRESVENRPADVEVGRQKGVSPHLLAE